MNLEEQYKNTSNILQSIILIFLAFLLFVFFFILLPYYPLADTYKILRNTDFLSEKINNLGASVNSTVGTYTDMFPDYNTKLRSINQMVDLYSLPLYDSKDKFKNVIFISGNEKIKKIIENETKSKTYDSCYPSINYDLWVACNGQEYRNDLKNENFISVDNHTISKINNTISNIQDTITKLQTNNNKSHIIENKELISANKLLDSLKDRLKEHHLSNTNSNLSYTTIDSLKKLGSNTIIPSLSPNLGNYKNEIKTAILDFNNNIQSLSFPLVGNVPFTLGQLFLAFPTVILLAFPFIILQFKKLIQLSTDPKKDKTSLSWTDPVQKGFGRFYPILVLLLPLILFLAFLVIVHDAWYSNVDYIEGYSLLADPSALIPQNRDIIMGVSILFFILFLMSHYPLVKYVIKKK